jgi:hypothetical protein
MKASRRLAENDIITSNPNNPVIILRFAILAIVPIEGAVLFELHYKGRKCQNPAGGSAQELRKSI